MIDHVKTSPITAMEALSNCNEIQDLELIGTLPLRNHSKLLQQAIDSNTLNDQFTIKNVFGLNTNFFYIIESIKNEQVNFYERGIGYAYEVDSRVFLKRIAPLANGKNRLECLPVRDNVCFPFSCCGESKSVVYSSVPPTYIESLVVENSVLCSSLSCIPQPVHMSKNSFLVRFDDNIECAPLNDDRLIDKIVDLVSKFTKQLTLKTTKLVTKRAQFELLDLVPSNNPKAKKGSLYYDESTDTIKVYNGQSWKTVAFLQD